MAVILMRGLATFISSYSRAPGTYVMLRYSLVSNWCRLYAMVLQFIPSHSLWWTITPNPMDLVGSPIACWMRVIAPFISSYCWPSDSDYFSRYNDGSKWCHPYVTTVYGIALLAISQEVLLRFGLRWLHCIPLEISYIIHAPYVDFGSVVAELRIWTWLGIYTISPQPIRFELGLSGRSFYRDVPVTCHHKYLNLNLWFGWFHRFLSLSKIKHSSTARLCLVVSPVVSQPLILV